MTIIKLKPRDPAPDAGYCAHSWAYMGSIAMHGKPANAYYRCLQCGRIKQVS